MLLDDPAHQVAVADVALVEDAVAHEHLRPRQQGVEDHRDVAGGLERLGRGGAEVARPAGDQDLHPARVAMPLGDADIVLAPGGFGGSRTSRRPPAAGRRRAPRGIRTGMGSPGCRPP